MKTKYLILILMIGLVSACATQTNSTPASQPTDMSAAPASAAADTSTPIGTAPANTAVSPTEASATPAADPGVTISFANDILPIFNSRCANCHGGNRTEEGLVLLNYADIIKGSDNGIVIVAGNANDSLLVDQVVSQKMPKRGPKLTPAQTQLIIDWVNQGALDN